MDDITKRIAILGATVAATLAVVAVVILPPIFGNLARSALDDLDEGVGLDAFGTDAELRVSFDDWDAGWFSSTAALKLNVAFGGISMLASETPFVATLRHGPVISGTPSGLGLASVELVLDGAGHPFLRELREFFDVDAAAHVGLLLGFGDAIAIGLNIPEFAHDGGFHFGGIKAVADMADDAIDFNGDFRGLLARDGTDGVEIGPVSLAASLYRDSRLPLMWMGSMRTDVAGFDAEDTGEIGPSSLYVDARVIEDRLVVRLDGEVSDFYFPSAGFPLRLDLAADVGLECGTDAVARLMQDFGSLQGLAGVLPMLLTADALVRERLSFDVHSLTLAHEGRSASATLAFEYRGGDLPGDVNIENFARMTRGLLSLPISANLGLAFHRELPGHIMRNLGAGDLVAAAIDENMHEMVRGGVFEEHGDDYTARLEFADREWVLNGETLDLATGSLGGQRSEATLVLAELVDELTR